MKKITEQQKKDISSLFKKTGNIREVARQFETVCSRRMIQLILDPKRMEAMKAHNRIYMQKKRLSLKNK